MLPLVLHAQNPTQSAHQPATPAWLAADRATLAKKTYTTPPPEIRRLVDAQWDLNVAFTEQSPTRKYFLDIREKEFPPLSAYGKTHLYFGGLEVDPKANRARSLTTDDVYALEVIDPTTGKRTPIETPKGVTIAQSRVVARRNAPRLHRQLRRRVPHLRRGPRDREVDADHDDAAARDARDDTQMDRGQQAHRDGVDSRQPWPRAQKAGARTGPGDPTVDGRARETPSGTSGACSRIRTRKTLMRVLHHGAARDDRHRDARR